MDTPSKPLVAISTCTGLHCLDNGLERGIAALRNSPVSKESRDSVIQYAAYVEIEAVAALNLVAQMEQGFLAPAPVWSDLKTFPWEQFYNKVHILTGGYPCQPFSQAGLQKGVVDPRHLFPYLEHGIDAVRPVLCFFENVANHLKLGYDEVRRRISNLGYKVEADIFSAEVVGAPHLRKRLFILAVADSYLLNGGIEQLLAIGQGERPRNEPEGSDRTVGHSNDFRQQQPDGNIGESRQRPCYTSEGTVADTDEQGLQKETGEGLDNRPEQCSGDVDNTPCNNRQQEDKIPARRNTSTCTSPDVDHAIRQRLEGQRRHGNAKKRWEESVRSIAASSVWPAGQGIHQYPWEESRLEPKMGSTINGYNFNEDYIRLLGNAVVEQTAELAFRTLIQKFL